MEVCRAVGGGRRVRLTVFVGGAVDGHTGDMRTCTEGEGETLTVKLGL